MSGGSPRPEWAGLFTDAVLFAASRLEQAPPEAAALIASATDRVWSLPVPATADEMIALHWQLFGFRSMIGSIDHAIAMAKHRPTSMPAALELARQVCEWKFPASFEDAMSLLETQTALHHQMLGVVRREIRGQESFL